MRVDNWSGKSRVLSGVDDSILTDCFAQVNNFFGNRRMRYKRKVLQQKRLEQAQKRSPTSQTSFDPNVLAPRSKWRNIVLSKKRERNEAYLGVTPAQRSKKRELDGDRRVGSNKRPFVQT